MRRRLFEVLVRHLALLSLLCFSGCGGISNPSKLPETGQVSGRVTLKGEPIFEAVLQFEHSDGSRSAVGKTDEQGQYTLTTFTFADGAVPGDYRVAITKMSPPPADAPLPQNVDDPNTPTYQPKNLLPGKYAVPQSSGLTATVAQGNNTIDFDLTP